MSSDSKCPPAAERREPLPVLRYSTADLPPAERHGAWSRHDWRRSQPVFRTQPSEPFDIRWESAQLGPLSFVCTEITGLRWERRLEDIRTSDFDPIIVSMMVEGAAQGDMDGRAFRQAAGTFHFQDLARPSLHVSTASLTYSLIIPRPVATEWFAPLQELHGLMIDGEAAAMLFSQAALIRQALPRLDIAGAKRLGRVVLELLALALAEARPAVVPLVSAEAVLRRRAVEAIEQRLGGGEVGVAELCKALDVTRGRLFTAFQADGGVQAFVTTRRLSRARAALLDVERAEAIGLIAHRLGFSDAAHLSRAFRQRYGMTPSEYRRLIAANGAGPDAPVA